MSADFTTNITITASGSELAAVIEVLKMYEGDHYKKGDIEAFLTSVEVDWNGKLWDLKGLWESERDSILQYGGTLSVEAGGPYGRFYPVNEARLFENLADAAPESEFKGKISGFSNDADEELEGNLEEGILYLKLSQTSWDEGPEATYEELFREVLPEEEFAELFGLQMDEGQLYDYYMEMTGALRDANFPEPDYSSFVRETGGMKLSEEQFLEIAQKAKDMGLKTMGQIDKEMQDGNATWSMYDPSIKEYIQN